MKNAKSIKTEPKGCGKFNQIYVGGQDKDGIPNIENVYCGKNGYLCQDCKRLNEQRSKE